MGLDYGYTCGTIDGNIDTFQSVVRGYLEDLLYEASPLLKGPDLKAILDTYSNNLFNDCQEIFEDVRKCNQDMRDEADRQIDNLEADKEELEEKIGDLEQQINDNDYDLSVLEERVRDLERENEELLTE